MDNAYHHGNLREELLRAAIRTLEEVGVEQLSIRRLAQAAGVSSGAPFKHFQSREDLLFCVALEGAAVLARAYEEAVASSNRAEDQLAAVCRAYVNLARDSPQLFRLMFESEIVVGDAPRPEWLQATEGAFVTFESAIASVAPEMSKAHLRRQTAFVWATIHGISSMLIHGRLHRFTARGDSADRIVGSAISHVIHSCKAARPGH